MKKKKSFIESIEAEAIEEAGSYFKDKITQKALKISEMSASFLLGFILLVVGVAEFTSHVFPILDNGISYLLFGAIFLIIGMLLR